MIHFKHEINMTGAISTLWRVLFVGWNKLAEERLHESKSTNEILISKVYVIKLLHSKDISWKPNTNLEC